MITIDPVERHLFLEGIKVQYGYDFGQYAEASLNRRLASLMAKHGVTSLIDILKPALKSNEYFRAILPSLTINTTEFFRDPTFFKALRETVLPVLKTYPKLTIWTAGCSTGEEVLSLAILLEEEGLLSRTTIHATDINPDVLRLAKEGIYEASVIQNFNKNYVLSGGANSPSDYYRSEYGLVRFERRLLEHVVFSEHNLATDSVFVEAHLVLCRNVLIYFSRELQNRAFNLFARSLIFKGFMGIGSKESVRFSSAAPFFDSIDLKENIYSLKARTIIPNLTGPTTIRSSHE